MRTTETLAIVGITAAVGGGVEASWEFNADAVARAAYVTAKTCALAFDVRSGTEGGELGPSRPGLVDAGTDAASAELVSFPLVGRPGASWVISKATLSCLRAGAWIPDGEPVDTSDMRAGDPEQLLKGYAELQKSSSESFDASSTILGLLMGAGLGGIIDAYRRRRERQKAS